MALIDILLPVYNGSKFLTKSLDSIKKQTFKDFRCFVLDDGSIDNSKEIINRYCEEDNRFILIEKNNSGIIDTLNYGLDLIDAPYIARCDADDVNTHKRFELQIDYLLNHPLAVAVGGRQFVIDDYDRVLKIDDYNNLWSVNAYSIPAREPYLPHPFVMLNADYVLGNNIRYRNFLHAEDADLYWRLSQLGVLYNITDYVGYYRVHTSSVSTLQKNARIQMYTASLAALSHQRVIEGRGEFDISDCQFLELKTNIQTFSELQEFFKNDLNEHEQKFIDSASIVKYMDFSFWRLYEPDRDDFEFLVKHSLQGENLSGNNIRSAIMCYIKVCRKHKIFKIKHLNFKAISNLFRFFIVCLGVLINKLAAAN